MKHNFNAGPTTITEIPPNQGASERVGMLIIKPMNQWNDEASRRPVPRDLFRTLIYENDITIIFGTTGSGKSMFAVQFAEEVSKREKVIYLDCELSDMQIKSRYTSEDGKIYQFPENLLRVEIDVFADLPQGMNEEEYLIKSLEDAIVSTGTKIVIVDNLTWLRNDTEKAKDALGLMKKLQKIKKRYDITMIVLAHSPKRDETRPITINDLSGSMMLANSCDAMTAVGKCSTDPQMRYLKQLKSRYDPITYSTENVMLYQLERRADGFTGFTSLGYGNELDYLKPSTILDKKERDEQIMVLHRLGKTDREIAKELSISTMTVWRIIKKKDVML